MCSLLLVKFFSIILIWWLIIIFLNKLIKGSYFNATITTLEKRYKISSRNMGLISVGNDISSLFLSVFIAYYGGKSHRPRWIGIGLISIVIFCIMNATPHFVNKNSIIFLKVQINPINLLFLDLWSRFGSNFINSGIWWWQSRKNTGSTNWSKSKISMQSNRWKYIFFVYQ